MFSSYSIVHWIPNESPWITMKPEWNLHHPLRMRRWQVHGGMSDRWRRWSCLSASTVGRQSDGPWAQNSKIRDCLLTGWPCGAENLKLFFVEHMLLVSIALSLLRYYRYLSVLFICWIFLVLTNNDNYIISTNIVFIYCSLFLIIVIVFLDLEGYPQDITSETLSHWIWVSLWY